MGFKKIPKLHTAWSTTIVVFGVLLFLQTSTLYAQVALSGTNLEALQIKVDPEFPAPQQEVAATISSNIVDLDRAKINWKVDGEPVAATGSAKRINFVANDLGENTRLTVTVQTAEGKTLSKEMVLKTATLDLLWEADSYTPPFYKGKGLATVGSNIKVVAVPDIRNSAGRKLSNDELIFIWKQANRVVSSASGRGKSSAVFPGPELYKDFDVMVEVSSLDQTAGAVNRLVLAPQMPQIHLYEFHPTLGSRIERALETSTDLPGGEISVIAEPYFFAGESKNNRSLSYEWSLNKEPVKNPSADPSLIVLRTNTEGGAAQVEVTIKHLSRIFQQASRTFGITFGSESSF